MKQKVKFIAKEVVLRIGYIMSKDCIFCKIASGATKTDLIWKSELVVAFSDVNPVAKTHILIIPKRHIASALTIKETDGKEIVEMYKAAADLVKLRELSGFRLIINGGKLQHVGHLHMHLIAGGKVDLEKI